MIHRSAQLAEFPELGRVIPELGIEKLRELLEGEYRLMYELFANRVEVWGIAHGRQQLLAD